MRLLMLGGTGFVGRAVAQAAARRGWQVTVFHRGRHEPPPGVAHVLNGDRTADGGLAALEGGDWDAVVDTWSGAADAVRASARRLAEGGRVEKYVYISSRSVYAGPVAAGLDETGPVVAASAADTAEETGGDYARDKRGGELAACESFGDRALLVRAGLILGPGEDVGRLPWWLLRMARGGAVPAPGPRELPIQYIDVRDLAEWVLDALPAGLSGPYNLVSPPGHTTMGEFLETCARVTGGGAELHWRSPESVLASGAEPWVGLPVWLPPGADYDHMHRGDVSKALAAGLRCRPVGETVEDTWEWLRRLGGEAPLRPDRSPKGLDAETEARLLAMPG
ncbi:NAD-dependent epimerase/dehydratase family protein [Streptomyces sp. WMMB 714]|uniref:NAD-dependent epimerase/dehydratase family protein n=1 Tax=Streptomyces sp. WMMB 714 TaxID=1286822 RepID=UPI000943DAAA|nr:NAD-dependent epimerase/dehydratase family protein [Streptomyces sp. WMMB 714]